MKMKARINSCGLILLLTPTISPGSARGQEIDRGFAQTHMDESIARVRKNMDSDANIVQGELIDDLAKVVGDDPRVLNLCDELIKKSTNPLTIRYALLAANIVHTEFDAGGVSKMAEIYRRAAGRGDLDTKIDAAKDISALGGQYREEGHHMFAHLLKKYPAASSKIIEAMIPTFGLTPEVTEHYGWIIEKSNDTALIQDALSGLRTIAASHKQQSNKTAAKETIANYFRLAMKSNNPAIQLNGAFYLAEMGDSYQAEARQFYEKRLRRSFGSGPDADAAKWESIRILRPMLQENRKEDHPLLRDAAKSNNLVEYFEKRFVSQDDANGFNKKMAERWKAILSGE